MTEIGIVFAIVVVIIACEAISYCMRERSERK